MKRILVLKTTKKDYDIGLQSALNDYKSEETEIVMSWYEDIIISIKNNDVKFSVSGHNIDDFDLIYFKSWQKRKYDALSIATYADARGVPVVDELVKYTPSSNKIFQSIKLALNGFQVPNSLYFAVTNKSSYSTIVEMLGSERFIMKNISGREGEDNYLIGNEAEFKDAFENSGSSIQFIFQEIIENVFDYRFGVMGDQVAYVKKRTRGVEQSHLNNIAQGASVDYIDLSDSSVASLKGIAVDASKLFRINVSGVDIITDKEGNPFILEVNRSPAFRNDYSVIQSLTKYLESLANN